MIRLLSLALAAALASCGHGAAPTARTPAAPAAPALGNDAGPATREVRFGDFAAIAPPGFAIEVRDPLTVHLVRGDATFLLLGYPDDLAARDDGAACQRHLDAETVALFHGDPRAVTVVDRWDGVPGGPACTMAGRLDDGGLYVISLLPRGATAANVVCIIPADANHDPALSKACRAVIDSVRRAPR